MTGLRAAHGASSAAGSGGRPVLGICGHAGHVRRLGGALGPPRARTVRWPGTVERLPAGSSRTWAGRRVRVGDRSRLFAGVESERFYFVHSYAVQTWGLRGDRSLRGGGSGRHLGEHGAPFVAAVENGPLSATQFHPEKSGGRPAPARELGAIAVMRTLTDHGLGWNSGGTRPALPRKPAQRHTESTIQRLNHKETRRDRTEPRLELLPAVDIAGGQAVQLVQGIAGSGGRFGDPWEAAKAWQDQGAEWIHLVDLDAAFGRGSNRDLIDTIVRRLDISVELSGGIRDAESLDAALATGCRRVNIGTAALEDPSGPDGSSVSTATGSPSASTCGGRRWPRGAGP